ncbi:hypothetical protein Ntsu_22730 [Nocardia sp. IFM 10818]
MATRRRAVKPKVCVDCVKEEITTKRKAPHPGPRCATHHRKKRTIRRDYSHEKHIGETYGITKEEYWAIYEAQGRKCAICRRATGVRKKLSVDHDHATGMVRGLLCTMCNRNVLGHLRDEPEAFDRGKRYLSHPPAVEVIGCRIVPEGGAPVKGRR